MKEERHKGFKTGNGWEQRNKGYAGKKIFRKSWLFFRQRSLVIFFWTLVPPLQLPEMPALALLLLVGASQGISLNCGSPGYGPDFPVLSLPGVTDCSASTFLAVQDSSFGSMDEMIDLFKHLPDSQEVLGTRLKEYKKVYIFSLFQECHKPQAQYLHQDFWRGLECWSSHRLSGLCCGEDQ